MSNATKAQNWADEESSDEDLGSSPTKSKPRIDHKLSREKNDGAHETDGSASSRRQDRPQREYREGERAPRSDNYPNRRSTGDYRGGDRSDRNRPDSQRPYEGGRLDGRGGGRQGGYRDDSRRHGNYDDRRFNDREHRDEDDRGRSNRLSFQLRPTSDAPTNSSEPSAPTVPNERPKLVLLPRTADAVINDPVTTNSKIFGEAKPRDEKAYMEKKKEVEKSVSMSEDQAPLAPTPIPVSEHVSVIDAAAEKSSRRSEGGSGRGEGSGLADNQSQSEGSDRRGGRDSRGEGSSESRRRSRGEGWGRRDVRKSAGGLGTEIENSDTFAFPIKERRPPRTAYASNGDFGRGSGGRARSDQPPVQKDKDLERPPVADLDFVDGDLIKLLGEVVKVSESTANQNGIEVEASTVDSACYLTDEPSPITAVDRVKNLESIHKDHEESTGADPNGGHKEKGTKEKKGSKVGRRVRDQTASAHVVPNTSFQKSVSTVYSIVKMTATPDTPVQTPVMNHKPMTDAEKFRKAQEEFVAKQHSDSNPAAKAATSKGQKNAFIALMDEEDDDDYNDD